MIRSRLALSALASPARQEIVDALEAGGAMTIAELGAQLGKAADALYFHLRRLERAGLVRVVDRRRVGKSVAAVYDVPARPMRIDRAAVPARSMDAVATSILRLGLRDYRRGLQDDHAVLGGAGRNLWAARHRGWLTPARLGEFNAKLDELMAIITSGRPGPGTSPVAFVMCLTPVRPTRGAARRSKKERGS